MSWWYQTKWWQWPLVVLLLPLSLLFWLIASVRRLAFRAGLKRAYRASVPVIVVGNISVGGNGKTPMVIALIETLRQQGYRVGVVSRGYGGNAPHYPLLVNATTLAAHCGDEPLLIASRCQVPVMVDAQRARACQTLIDAHQVNVIISDDGMQHYAMARDIEIAIIDGERGHGNALPLPAGPLRELPSRLKHVDFVVYNGGGELDARQKQFVMTLKPQGWRSVRDNGMRELLNQSAVALAAIGAPQRFFASLKGQGIALKEQLALVDHGRLNDAQLAQYQGELLLMTEKDAMKYRDTAGEHWLYQPVSAHLDSRFYQLLLQRLKEIAHENRS